MIYKKTWKYILVRDYPDYGYYRPKSLKDFSDVYKNDIGGYLEGYRNLSQFGDCWIYDEALVINNSKVSENAMVAGKASIDDNVEVYGNAKVSGHANISENAKEIGRAHV